MWQRLPAEGIDTARVDSEREIPTLRLDRLDGAAYDDRAHSRISEDYVDATQEACRFRHGGAYCFGRDDVAGDERRLFPFTTQPLRECATIFFVDIENRDGGALGGKPACRGSADAGRGPTDDRPLAFESSHVQASLPG